jgi:hypothetical protein
VIDVGEVVLRNLTVLPLPNFFPQSGATPGPLQQDRFVYDLFPGRLPVGPLRHISIIPQMGHRMYHLHRTEQEKSKWPNHQEELVEAAGVDQPYIIESMEVIGFKEWLKTLEWLDVARSAERVYV